MFTYSTQGLDVQDMKEAEKLAKSMALLKELKPRMKGAFASEDAMYLTAVGAVMEMRMELERKRERMFAKTEGWADQVDTGYDELIVGGGPSAAAYAATRTASGKPRPLVVSNVLGGESFSTTLSPWFDLNSRNRPGDGGLPSEGAALNVIPNAPVQGENLNMAEFQNNSDIGYVVRTALLRFADLHKGVVERVERALSRQPRRFVVKLASGAQLYADRVIDARGMGEPSQLRNRAVGGKIPFSERIWSFSDFAKRFDQPFPFRDLDRVAVIGDGDSARVVAEALLGIGPSQHMSVPMLDWVAQVDWYGPSLPSTCEDWRSRERGRYQRLGSFLRAQDNGIQRLRVFRDSGYPSEGLDRVYVGGRPYDAAIVCIGFEQENTSIEGSFANNDFGEYAYAADARTALARTFDGGTKLVRIGVAANLGFDDGDTSETTRIENNRVALFRLLPRIVQLAIQLPVLNENIAPPEKPKPVRRPRKRPVKVKFAEPLGYDREGEPIFEGDRVVSGSSFTGVVVRSAVDGYPLAVIRDDGVPGGNPSDDGWVIPSPETLEPARGRVISNNNKILGYDVDGESIRVGDKVEFIEEEYGSYVTGTVVARDSDAYRFGVKRDDGKRGGGSEGAWLIDDERVRVVG
jgi:hypothetical protein